MRMRLFLAVIAVAVSSLACAGRVFETTHVYSLSELTVSQAYEPNSGTILADNVWVFRPDGTFEARIPACNTRDHLFGSYSGDDVGSEFLFLLDLNEDGQGEDTVRVDVKNDEYAYIEWDCDDQTLRFILIQ